MLNFLFYFACSLRYIKTIERYSDVVVFPSFGFEKGGNFHIEFFVSNIKQSKSFYSKVLLITESKYYDIESNFKNSKAICTKTVPGYKDLTIFQPDQQNQSWIYKIPKKDVYVPIIFNCYREYFDVYLYYENISSALDRRFQLIPYIALISCIAYIILTLLWIFNIYRNQRFDILLTRVFAISTAVKAQSLGVFALVWTERSEHDSFRDSYSLLYRALPLLFGMMANSYIFLVNYMSSTGVGILRRYIPFKEVLSKYFRIFLFFACVYACENATHYIFSTLLIFQCVFIFFLYLSDISSGSVMAHSIAGDYPNNQQILSKCSLVQKFVETYFKLILSMSLCIVYCSFSKMQGSVQFAAVESMIFVVSLMDYLYFRIRHEFHPPPLEPLEDRVQLGDIAYIEDPNFSQYSFLHVSDEPEV